MSNLELNREGKTAFSFEVLPPLKGMGTEGLFASIDKLMDFKPHHINITTHRSEITYQEVGDNVYKKRKERKRPGTVAVAAAIKNKYDVTVVPHILCSGYTKDDTEYALLDLQFLGITDLLVLRGDKAKDENIFKPVKDGYSHALELEQQINDFNSGKFVDGSPIKATVKPFHYGVAGYPEKHEESPNFEQDLHWLKAKVDAGAEYVVTQMFFDNEKFISYVKAAREDGINVPIIPGIKPFTKLSQLAALPKTFNTNLPKEFVDEALKCKNDDDAKALGIEWCTKQCRELIDFGIPCLHFFTYGAVDSVRKVAEAIY